MKLGVFFDWRNPRGGTAYPFSAYQDDLLLMQSCGVSAIVLGLSPRHLTSRRPDVIRATELAHAHGLETHLMVWAHRRDPRFFEQRLPALRLLCVATRSQPVLNAERPWREGDATPQNEAELCFDALDGLDWAVACLAHCQSATRPLARLAPRSIPEAYSVTRPICTPPPPWFQRKAYQSWQEAGANRIELGLGAYHLERPGMSARQVLRGQLEAARELGCQQVWLWSLKWIRAQQGWMVGELAEFS